MCALDTPEYASAHRRFYTATQAKVCKQESVVCLRWMPTNFVVNQFTLDRIHKFYLSCTNTLPLHARTHAAQSRIHLIALSACKNVIAAPEFVLREFGSVRSVAQTAGRRHTRPRK